MKNQHQKTARTTSLLLTLCMVFSLLGMSTTALADNDTVTTVVSEEESSYTTITYYQICNETIKQGERSTITFGEPDSGDVMAYGELLKGTIPDGMKYSVGMGGYSIYGTPTTPGTYTSYWSSTYDLAVSHKFEVNIEVVGVTEISAVTITGIDAPVAGEYPDGSAVAGHSTYTVRYISWDPPFNIAEAGETYTVTAYLQAADNAKFSAAPTATINGNAATVVSGGGTAELAISYTFAQKKVNAPVITTQPKTQSVTAGADVTFTVAAAGDDLSYQWWVVDAGVPAKIGTDSPSLILRDVTVSQYNNYDFWCVVSNAGGEATSNKAHLTVSEKSGTSFTDVPSGAYYEQAVGWAVAQGITLGTTDTTFSPSNTCTRGQIITFLWRASGSPEPAKTTAYFTDVSSDRYYFKACQWAYEQNMASGSTFAPNSPCTRAMAVEFMWKQQGCPAAAMPTFTDVPATVSYAEAVGWAVAKGVTLGTTDTTFSPDNTCTRAQIVTFLYRYLGV